MDIAILTQYSKDTGLPFSSRSRCGRTAPEHLTTNQLAVHALAGMHAAGVEDTRGKRGALVWASTGSGKTGCCVCIVDAFWEARDFRRLVVVTSPSALKSNPPETFHRFAMLLPRFEGMDLEMIEAAFDRRGVEFTTFARLAHASGVYRPSKAFFKKAADGRTLYIVDEAHTVFRPLLNQRQEMKAVLETLFRDWDQDKFFLLTATPGDTPTEVLKLLNVLRSRTVPELKPPATREQARAFVEGCSFMVSRYDAARDADVYPMVRIVDVRLPMSIHQYSRYRQAVTETAAEDRDFDELKRQQKLNRLYASARRFSNALFQVDLKRPLRSASAKLPEILATVTGFDSEKHYVYSAFSDRRGFGGQGAHAVAIVLEEFAGYEQLPGDQFAFLARENTFPIVKKPRYAMVTASDLGQDTLQDIVAVFNHPANLRGEYLHVLIASGNFYESMDLKAVRHVHLFDPMLSLFAQQQAIGRACRRCSHDQLDDRASWTVTVHRYFAVAPLESDVMTLLDNAQLTLDEMSEGDPDRKAQVAYVKGFQDLRAHVRKKTVDEYLDELVRAKYQPLRTILQLLEMASVDCPVYHHTGFCRYNRTKPMPPPSATASS